jgi:MFS family permease
MEFAYAGAVVFAIGIAPLIPVYQGWTLTRTPSRLHGSMNAALGIGAALVTTFMVWVTGLAIDLNIRLPFAISVLLMLAVQAWAWRATRRRTAGQRPSGDAEEPPHPPLERAA